VRNVTASEAAPDVAANLWLGACAGGAQALRQPTGLIAPGRRADLVVLDGSEVDLESLDGPASLAVAMFSGGGNRVGDVFVAGRAVVTQGSHPAEEAIAARYREALRRLRAR